MDTLESSFFGRLYKLNYLLNHDDQDDFYFA